MRATQTLTYTYEPMNKHTHTTHKDSLGKKFNMSDKRCLHPHENLGTIPKFKHDES